MTHTIHANNVPLNFGDEKIHATRSPCNPYPTVVASERPGGAIKANLFIIRACTALDCTTSTVLATFHISPSHPPFTSCDIAPIDCGVVVRCITHNRGAWYSFRMPQSLTLHSFFAIYCSYPLSLDDILQGKSSHQQYTVRNMSTDVPPVAITTANPIQHGAAALLVEGPGLSILAIIVPTREGPLYRDLIIPSPATQGIAPAKTLAISGATFDLYLGVTAFASPTTVAPSVYVSTASYQAYE